MPECSEQNISIAFDPVMICAGSREVRLSLVGCEKKLSDYLLGAQFERVAVLKGHDELGRAVSTTVIF